MQPRLKLKLSMRFLIVFSICVCTISMLLYVVTVNKCSDVCNNVCVDRALYDTCVQECVSRCRYAVVEAGITVVGLALGIDLFKLLSQLIFSSISTED